MKVLMVNDYRDKIGGAEIYMHTLKSELEKRGNEVEIFSSSLTKEEYILDQSKKSYYKAFKRVFNVSSLFSFKKQLNNFKPDIIHLHGILNELTPSILLSVKNTPIVMTVHNNLMVNSVTILSARTGLDCKSRICEGCRNCVGIKRVVFEKLKKAFHRKLFKRVNLYIAPSNYMKHLLEEAGFNPVKHIQNGFELYKFSKITNFNKLLYIGRLSSEKGTEFLIKAMPNVVKLYPEVKLLIIGDGPEKYRLQKLINELKVIECVKVISNVKREDIQAYYKESTIIIVPSVYNDNFPTVCIEAMSVGRPIVGTKLGGIPELVDDGVTGFLVKPKSSGDIAETLNKMLKNKNQLKEMSQNSYLKSKAYDINTHINNIEKIYFKLLKK